MTGALVNWVNGKREENLPDLIICKIDLMIYCLLSLEIVLSNLPQNHQGYLGSNGQKLSTVTTDIFLSF